MSTSSPHQTRHWFRLVHLLLNGDGHEVPGAAPSGFIARLGLEQAFLLSETAYRHAMGRYLAHGRGPHHFRCAVFEGIHQALEAEPFRALSDTVRSLVLQDARRTLMLAESAVGVEG